jgi:hypothetical protein
MYFIYKVISTKTSFFFIGFKQFAQLGAERDFEDTDIRE